VLVIFDRPISDDEVETVRAALAQPAAPVVDGELPPLPKPECLLPGVYAYRAKHMSAYGAACFAVGRGSAVRDYITLNEASLAAARSAPGGVPEGWIQLPKKLTGEMIYSALAAHYGKRRIDAAGGPDGIDMTVNDTNYSGTQALRRMWQGLLAAAPSHPEPAGGKEGA
jgi:hypothetical protein